MRQIPLSSGKGWALVDDEDYERLAKYSWSLHSEGYAFRRVQIAPRPQRRWRYYYMHREVAGTPDGLETDHRNGDKLDNQRRNLIPCGQRINQLNRKKTWSASGVVGITWYKSRSKWRAYATIDGQYKCLGYFKEKADAIAARAAAVGTQING